MEIGMALCRVGDAVILRQIGLNYLHSSTLVFTG